ncbi:hypothetical protein FZI91_00350 [Mycobacterium sp. CBMA271]|uniref:hypothetical protein n=1 Tax=unclassified Mycobacteroides TaxID=2618759 RepID=UPI0012DF0D28|nr:MULTISPECIES: hypothetical protein [unclassified Mycobacteroides]MUM19984.1 hypothetical protein [Mycobacteroides sp. CBMA 326]MUM20158.1 hypothetical protein [Mycobacteroides sp. CBMA 271]
MGAFAESWRLLRTSVQILRAWSVLIGFAGRAILWSMVVAVLIYLATLAIPDTAGWARAGVVGVGYLLAAYVTVVYEAALVTQAHLTLGGADPSLRAGTVAAASKRRQLMPWVLITAAETYAVSDIEGTAATTLAGGLWLAITMLILPTIMLTDTAGWTAILKALNLLRKHWALGVIGAALVTTATAILVSPGLVLLTLEPESTELLLLFGALALVWLLPTVIISLALVVVYQTLLFQAILYRTAVG